MDGKLISIADNRKTAFGFKVGQRVKLINGGKLGTVIGFASAWHDGCTLKIKLDDNTGNMGDHHSCGDRWVESAE